jgi:5-methylcytosine-specific restriction endonuclease McrA
MPRALPCLELVNGRLCGRLSQQRRCPEHQSARDRARNEQSYYQSPAWRSLSALVVRRDRLCVVLGCGSRHRLAAHHLRPRTEGGPDHPANLITLCASCHSTYEADVRACRDTWLRRIVEAFTPGGAADHAPRWPSAWPSPPPVPRSSAGLSH